MIYLPIYKTTTTPNNMFLLDDLAAGILKPAAITNETYEYILEPLKLITTKEIK